MWLVRYIMSLLENTQITFKLGFHSRKLCFLVWLFDYLCHFLIVCLDYKPYTRLYWVSRLFRSLVPRRLSSHAMLKLFFWCRIELFALWCGCRLGSHAVLFFSRLQILHLFGINSHLGEIFLVFFGTAVILIGRKKWS